MLLSLFYKDFNMSTEHNLSVSGGNEHADYYVSGRYYNMDGIYKVGNESYNRYDLRAKGSLKIRPWLKITNNISVAISDQYEPKHPRNNFNIQKAINYSMTSFFTTGGIRGGKKKMDKFYPRSFNMGVRRTTYQALGGFSKMRFGEDIDFSIRVFKNGYSCRLFPNAWVYHKRRVDLKKFFKQVHNFGMARINLYKKYPKSLKIVHLLPGLFTLGTTALLLLAPFWPWSLLPLALYALLVCVDSATRNHSLRIGIYSIAAAFIQLLGYGSGFWRAWWQRCVLRRAEETQAFRKNFYK